MRSSALWTFPLSCLLWAPLAHALSDAPPPHMVGNVRRPGLINPNAPMPRGGPNADREIAPNVNGPPGPPVSSGPERTKAPVALPVAADAQTARKGATCEE